MLGEGVWKWIAAILAAILLSGMPGLVYAIRTPSSAEVEVIRDRQQIVLQRLAAIEVRLNSLETQLSALYLEQARQSDKLNAHIEKQGSP